MQDTEYVEGLLEFLKASPTPFHAVKQMQIRLSDAGYKELKEAEVWGALSTGKYYVIRNDSSVIAFSLVNDPVEQGFRMVGAHTDSPCLKVKPNPEIIKESYLQLGVEVYGGALLNPWFDRDLSLAGRVSFVTGNGDVEHALIDFENAIAVIPSLAIHLDREANESRTIDKQKHIPPVLMKLPSDQPNDHSDDRKNDSIGRPDFREILQHLLSKQSPGVDVEKILDYELSFYDVQPSTLR